MNYSKNTILRTLELLNIVSFIIFAFVVNTERDVSVIICTCNIIYLLLFYYANIGYISRKIKKKKQILTCTDCKRKNVCPERSRGSACTSFKKKEVV